jgi:hypothetical protein
MPVHDWTRVDAGIFHAFHHSWIEEIARALNGGLLPDDYYALPEQHAAGFGPDILTLQGSAHLELYHHKQSTVAVRHASGDRIVAMVEVVSPGNKAGRAALRSFVEKATELLGKRIHLLILDLHPPGPRDPQGIHGAIWEELTGTPYTSPPDKLLTLAAYESGLTVRAYVEPVAVRDVLADMPLFLEPGAHVLVPLEATYQAAWQAVPRRWRAVLERPAL